MVGPDHYSRPGKTAGALVEPAAPLEKFIETGDLSEEEIITILRKATIARRVVPVYCGSAFKNKGIQRLLDGVIR